MCDIIPLRVLCVGQLSSQRRASGHHRDPGEACGTRTNHFKRDVQGGGKTDGRHAAETRGGCPPGMTGETTISAD